MTENEMAMRRRLLALMEIGSCITDIANLCLKGMSNINDEASVLQSGGIALGLERAVVALRNQSWNDHVAEIVKEATKTP
jgi:hypothetical protein